MQKSLVRKLTRMAKDGDAEAVEAVAEMLEALTEAEGDLPAEAAVETAAAVAAAAEAAEEPDNAGSTGACAIVETPEATVVVDEATLADVISRLDRIITLLSPAAADEDPSGEDPAGALAEEILEAIGEAVAETAAETAAEAPEIPAEPGTATPEEVIAMVGELMEPSLSEVLEPEEPSLDESCCDPEKPAADTQELRAALAAIRPAMVGMTKAQRQKAAADIAAKLWKKAGISAADGSTYAALAKAARRRPAVSGDLGRKIMAARNANYAREKKGV